MQACIDAKRSYHPTPNSILVNRPNGVVYEIVLSVELVQLALLLPGQGATIGKTEPIKRDIMPYFQPLVGTYKDGLPIDKIVDPDIRHLAQIISHFLELSRGVRVKQDPWEVFLPHLQMVGSKGASELGHHGPGRVAKGIKVCPDFNLLWASTDQGDRVCPWQPWYLYQGCQQPREGLKENHLGTEHLGNPRNPRPEPNPQPNPNPILNAIPIGNQGDLGGEFFEVDRDQNDLYAS